MLSNNKVTKYIKKKLTEMEREIDGYTTIVEGFNTPRSVMEIRGRRSTRK